MGAFRMAKQVVFTVCLAAKAEGINGPGRTRALPECLPQWTLVRTTWDLNRAQDVDVESSCRGTGPVRVAGPTPVRLLALHQPLVIVFRPGARHTSWQVCRALVRRCTAIRQEVGNMRAVVKPDSAL